MTPTTPLLVLKVLRKALRVSVKFLLLVEEASSKPRCARSVLTLAMLEACSLGRAEGVIIIARTGKEEMKTRRPFEDKFESWQLDARPVSGEARQICGVVAPRFPKPSSSAAQSKIFSSSFPSLGNKSYCAQHVCSFCSACHSGSRFSCSRPALPLAGCCPARRLYPCWRSTRACDFQLSVEVQDSWG